MVVEALLANAAILFGVAVILWVVALQIGDAGFVRAWWGAGAALLALVSWMRLAQPGPLATLLFAMAAIWGVAVAVQELVGWRSRRASGPVLGDDRDMARGAIRVLVRAFLVPAVLIFTIASPAQYGILQAASFEPVSGLALVGAALYAVGLVLGLAGGRLFARLRKRGTAPQIGDACVWWGIWMSAASAGWWVAAWTVVGPLVLTAMLFMHTGSVRGMRR